MGVHPPPLQLPRLVHVRLPMPNQEQELRGRCGGPGWHGWCFGARGNRPAIIVAVFFVVCVVGGGAGVAGVGAGEARSVALVGVEAADGVRRGRPSLREVGVESFEGSGGLIQALRGDSGSSSGVSFGHRGKPAVQSLVGFVDRRRFLNYYPVGLALVLLHDREDLRPQGDTRAAAVVVGEGKLESFYRSDSSHSHLGSNKDHTPTPIGCRLISFLEWFLRERKQGSKQL